MKYILSIIALIYSLVVFGQISRQVDSSIVLNLAKLDKNNAKIFTDLYSTIIKMNLYDRLDTVNYDFAIVEATKIDSSLHVQEYYYFNESEAKPNIVYADSERLDPEAYFNWYKYYYKRLRTDIHEIQPLQTLNYEKKQIVITGCIKKSKTELIRRRKDTLKKTYQIQLYIRKKSKTTRISLQTPPSEPHFKIETHGADF